MAVTPIDAFRKSGQKLTDTDALNKLLSSVAILVVDDEPGMRDFLKRSLEKRCAFIEVAGSAEEAEALRLRYHFDLMLVDIKLPGLSGLEWLRQLRDVGVRTHVIYTTDCADLEMAIAALRNGAVDLIMKPFQTEQIFDAIQVALQKRQILRDNSLLRLQLNQIKVDHGVVGESQVIKDILILAERIASTQSNVLIQGETGTGKELIARTIHAMSNRTGKFVPINCATIAPELFDSELFGHLKGAVSGAAQSREGLFLHAEGGTLFLDEVGELPPNMQSKLLRVLEDKTIRQVGSEREIPVNVQVVAATNHDLLADSMTDKFRSDLYYRLNVLPICVPPLRERCEDIPALVEHFFNVLSSEIRLVPIELMHTDWKRLSDYHWPGNVRELKNVVERTMLLGRLPVDSMRSQWDIDDEVSTGYPLSWTVDAVERAHIETVLVSVKNNKSAAARQLGVSRKTLERKQNLWYGPKMADSVKER